MITDHAVVVVVTAELAAVRRHEISHARMTLVLCPILEVSQRPTQARWRRTLGHPRYPLAVRDPPKLEAQELEALGLLPQLKAAEPRDAALLGRDLQSELGQTLTDHSVEAFSLMSILERKDNIIRVADHVRPSLATGPHHFLEP